jgi:hypothetical protein
VAAPCSGARQVVGSSASLSTFERLVPAPPIIVMMFSILLEWKLG